MGTAQRTVARTAAGPAPGTPGPRVSADDTSVKDVAAWLRANGASEPDIAAITNTVTP